MYVYIINNITMKYFKLLSILLLCSVFFFSACNDKADSQKKPSKPFKQVQLNTPTTSQNAGGVWHYYCSKGCAGGSGAAGNCNNCSGALTHNQAYHTNANKTPTNESFNQSNAETGKNSAGVWHYTCLKGCSGGAAATGNCGSCGGNLTHNQAYHQ